MSINGISIYPKTVTDSIKNDQKTYLSCNSQKKTASITISDLKHIKELCDEYITQGFTLGGIPISDKAKIKLFQKLVKAFNRCPNYYSMMANIRDVIYWAQYEKEPLKTELKRVLSGLTRLEWCNSDGAYEIPDITNRFEWGLATGAYTIPDISANLKLADEVLRNSKDYKDYMMATEILRTSYDSATKVKSKTEFIQTLKELVDKSQNCSYPYRLVIEIYSKENDSRQTDPEIKKSLSALMAVVERKISAIENTYKIAEKSDLIIQEVSATMGLDNTFIEKVKNRTKIMTELEYAYKVAKKEITPMDGASAMLGGGWDYVGINPFIGGYVIVNEMTLLVPQIDTKRKRVVEAAQRTNNQPFIYLSSEIGHAIDHQILNGIKGQERTGVNYSKTLEDGDGTGEMFDGLARLIIARKYGYYNEEIKYFNEVSASSDVIHNNPVKELILLIDEIGDLKRVGQVMAQARKDNAPDITPKEFRKQCLKLK
jgi:hypothetical protein